MSSSGRAGRGSYFKVIAMALLLCVDLGLNSSLDYDSFNDNQDSYPSNFLLGLLGLQVIIEISIFLLLFLAMADTFLFRVGLLGLLLRKFRIVLIAHPLYVCVTLTTGLVRVQRIMNRGYNVEALWRDNTFIWLSSVQKTGALMKHGIGC
jgi:Transmembrane protein 138